MMLRMGGERELLMGGIGLRLGCELEVWELRNRVEVSNERKEGKGEGTNIGKVCCWRCVLVKGLRGISSLPLR